MWSSHDRGSVVVVSPHRSPHAGREEGELMRRVVGIDIHRTFGAVVFLGRRQAAGLRVVLT
jgi:hypothetical protein